MREITLAQSITSTGATARVFAQVDENDKIVKVVGESTGDAFCGFQCSNPKYTLEYGYNDYVEIITDDYLIDGELPDNFLSVKLKIWL